MAGGIALGVWAPGSEESRVKNFMNELSAWNKGLSMLHDRQTGEEVKAEINFNFARQNIKSRFRVTYMMRGR